MSTLKRRSLVLALARGLALLGVSVLFAVLIYRVAHGNPGAGLINDVQAHRAPVAPDVRLSVIWPHSETWPRSLQRSLRRGTFSLASLRGYPVVLNFWASWCTPCAREAPVLTSAARSQQGRVVFVAVDVNDFTKDARRFLGTHRVPYVAVRSGRSITERFGLVGLPETFYVDRLGRIRGMTRGQLSADVLRHQLQLASRS
jgi:thiol-disulfide isomerase/thioredoxin